MLGLHHWHVRHRKPEAASKILVRMLDPVVYVVGILGPLATIPQVIQIYTTHDATGVSAATWGMYALFDIPWIVYAFVHKARPLIVCYLLWFLFNTLVAIGALLYGTGTLSAL